MINYVIETKTKASNDWFISAWTLTADKEQWSACRAKREVVNKSPIPHHDYRITKLPVEKVARWLAREEYFRTVDQL